MAKGTSAITWLMPLLFVVSGVSLFYAVRKSGALKFVKDKVLRLALPIMLLQAFVDPDSPSSRLSVGRAIYR